MRVYFLRHGIAVEAADWKGADRDRPLTPKGRKQMEREAKAFAEMELGIELIITSPLARAQETAFIVADGLKMRDRVVDDERLAESFTVDSLADISRERPNMENVMLVGHEPSMSAVIGQIIGGGRIELKKGGLARVDMIDATPLRGELNWLLPPQALTR